MSLNNCTPETYCRDVAELIGKLDTAAMERAVSLVESAYRDSKMIFVAGNGGSAATATHFAADFGKNVVTGDMPKPRIMSLCDNLSSLTAYANDEGYDTIFERPLSAFASEGDILVLISASGNSPNVVKAANWAKAHGLRIISMTGFSGGTLREMADVPLYIPCDRYEPVEDIQSLLCHMLVSCVKSKIRA